MQKSDLQSIPRISLPALHTWPLPLKKAVLIGAYLLCGLVYLLLLAGLVGVATILLTSL